ncbi:MAG: DUF2460 domain-containing protein, partial [Pseudomonadota bacterium]
YDLELELMRAGRDGDGRRQLLARCRLYLICGTGAAVAVGFRFKDWGDFKAVNQPLLSLGGTQYQLVKQYVSGAVVSERIITKPVAGTVKLYRNSLLQASGWSIDTATGIITTSLTGTLTVDFDFDVPVRFDTDELALSLDSFNAGSWNNIPLIEVRI